MKNVCIIYADAFNATATDEATTKFLKKSIHLTSNPSGDISALASLPELKEVAFESFTKEYVEKYVALSTKVADFNQALPQVLDAVSRFTLYIVVTPSGVYFAGYGVNSKGAAYDKEYSVSQVLVTICAISEALLPENPEGAIIYPILKDPNAKTKDLQKAQTTIDSLEEAITRSARNPWDKHDCA